MRRRTANVFALLLDMGMAFLAGFAQDIAPRSAALRGLLPLRAITREGIGDFCLKFFCCCDIGIARRRIALLELC